MSEIAFKFADMIQEIRMFEAFAKDFLDEMAPSVLNAYVRQLEFIQSTKRSDVTPWSISPEHPLRTNVSHGEYESGQRRGREKVVAALSTNWHIYCPNEGGKKVTSQRHFHLTGLASTLVKFLAINLDGSEELLSTWQADIGDTNSPGCHFHIQVQRECDVKPYPSSFPVPRFPTLLTSPLSVAEFAISELFQSAWSRHTVSRSSNLLTWSRIQRDRMDKLLCWQKRLVNEASGSPLPYLKEQKPDLGIFI